MHMKRWIKFLTSFHCCSLTSYIGLLRATEFHFFSIVLHVWIYYLLFNFIFAFKLKERLCHTSLYIKNCTSTASAETTEKKVSIALKNHITSFGGLHHQVPASIELYICNNYLKMKKPLGGPAEDSGKGQSYIDHVPISRINAIGALV